MGMDFVALDVETANSDRGSVCAIGLSTVAEGVVVRTDSLLCKPPGSFNRFESFNTRLHGISASSVADSPSFSDRLSEAVALIGGRPVVCHNASFDMGAIRDACVEDGVPWPSLTYACTLVLSRRALPHLISYRLPIVAEDLGVPLLSHHDAGQDAEACARVALELARRQSTDSLDALLADVGVRFGLLDPTSWTGCVSRGSGGGHGGGGYGAAPEANADADSSHPFFGQVMVFTGALAMPREEAWAAVAVVGATPKKEVTKQTTILVIGDGFAGDSIGEFRTGKALKAFALLEKGHSIEVLTEGDFFDALRDTASSGSRLSA
jgi:DNA polymerase-3 subunit epsilon